MGRRGPRPLPSLELARRGSWRAADRARSEARVARGAIAPAWLSADARVHWDRLAPILDGAGLLSAADADALAHIATALADWLRARAELATRSPVVQMGTNGAESPSAWVLLERAAFDRWYKLAKEFGLTPAARVGLAATPSDGAADAAKVLGIA